MSGPAVNQDLIVYADNSVPVLVPIKSPAGLAVDLSGCSAKWWAGDLASRSAVIKKSTADASLSIVTAGTDTGGHTIYALRFEISAADTADLTAPAQMYHEAEVTDGAGKPRTVMTGALKLRATLIR